MQYIAPDVSTVCIGQAASMGAVLLCAGAEGKRQALPNARIMIHQPLGGFQGQASDVEIHAKEMLRVKGILTEIMMRHTGNDRETLTRDMDRDFFMSAMQSKEYGIIDEVIEKHAPVKSANGDSKSSS